MRPLRGIVTAVTKTSLEVKLETGLTKVISHFNKNLQCGQSILVGYNFLNGEIKIIEEK